jgi:hypothetical protein
MTRIERSNEKYNRAKVKELLRADKAPPEKRVSNIKELLEYLDGPECICAALGKKNIAHARNCPAHPQAGGKSP